MYLLSLGWDVEGEAFGAESGAFDGDTYATSAPSDHIPPLPDPPMEEEDDFAGEYPPDDLDAELGVDVS